MCAHAQYGVPIVISEYTNDDVKEVFITRELDLVAVKGKEDGVKIFELVAVRPEAAGRPLKDPGARPRPPPPHSCPRPPPAPAPRAHTPSGHGNARVWPLLCVKAQGLVALKSGSPAAMATHLERTTAQTGRREASSWLR